MKTAQFPQIINTDDALIWMTKTTICGTDLGIWKGKNPEIQEHASDENAMKVIIDIA